VTRGPRLLALALTLAAACSSSSDEASPARLPHGATIVKLVYRVSEPLPPGVRLEDAQEQALSAIRERLDALDLEQPSVLRRDGAIQIEYLTRDPQPADLDRVADTISHQRLLRFRLSAHDEPALRTLCGHAEEEPAARAADVRASSESISHERGTTEDRYLTAPSRDALQGFLDRIGADRLIPSQYQLVLEEEAARPDQPARWRTHLVARSSVLTGRQVTQAQLTYDPQTNRPTVELEFDSAGARLLELMTRENIGTRMVVTLDDRVVTAAVIQSRIGGGRAVITPGHADDPEAATELAQEILLAIREGSLPAPLELVVQSTTVIP